MCLKTTSRLLEAATSEEDGMSLLGWSKKKSELKEWNWVRMGGFID